MSGGILLLLGRPLSPVGLHKFGPLVADGRVGVVTSASWVCHGDLPYYLSIQGPWSSL